MLPSSRFQRVTTAVTCALVIVISGVTGPSGTSAQDLSVPDQPANFDAVAGDGQVWLSWDPRADGSAPIIKYQLWRLTRSLPALTQPVQGTDDEFGYSVAVAGDMAVVGMPGEDGPLNSGAAFVFTRDPTTRIWTPVTRLRAKDPGADNSKQYRFGLSIATDGNTIIVGAEHENRQGAVYIFTKPASGSWASATDLTESALFTAATDDDADSMDAGDNFGRSVAVDGDTIVVGASGERYAAVYTKDDSGWDETVKLTGSRDFGHSVAIDGNTIVVGATGVNSNRGSASVFVKPSDGWDTITDDAMTGISDVTVELSASDRDENDQLGTSVAIDGDTIVVGAYADDNGTGSAYVFIKPAEGWTASNGEETGKLTASDRSTGDRFGQSVAVDGDIVVVGAPYEASGSNYDRGSAYVFAKPAGGWAGGTETAKVPGPAATADDQFGFSVAIDGDTVLIAANWYGANDRGAVFEHRIVGWSDIEGSTGATTSHELTGLTNGVQESVAVRAVNDGGAGLPDNDSATPQAAASAPLAPRNLSAVQTAAGEVRLEWRPSDYPLNVTRYEYSTDDGSNWIGVSGSDSTTASGFVSSLAAGTHTFTIRAGNSAGDGGSSHARSVTIVAAPPTAPTALDPYVGDRQAQLRWSFSGDQDLISGFQYQVRSGGVFGNDWTDVPGGTATRSHIVTGLTNDTSHSFRVRAVNGTIGSATSNEVSRLPTAARSTPASPRGLAGAQVGVGRVELTWRAASQPLTVSGYQYYQYTPGVGSAWNDIPESDSSTASYTVSGLDADNPDADKSYGFAVRAVNSVGWSGSSNSVTLTPDNVPARLTGFGAEPGDTQATLDWTDPTTTRNRPVSKFQLLQVPLSKLTDGNTEHDNDEFGYSVALDGDTAVVGAPGANSGKGAAYVFTRDENGWGTPVELRASNGVVNDKFGNAVAIDGNTIVVGAYRHGFDGGGGPVSGTGAAYVFRQSSTGEWGNNPSSGSHREETATLFASVRAIDDEFGISVAVAGETAVVGAHQHNANGNSDAGAAYVFTRTSTTDPITNETTYIWGETPAAGAYRIETAKLTATDGAADDRLGISVAVDGDTVLVGAHKYDVPTITDSIVDSGGVYIFTKTGASWSSGTETALLTAADAAASDEFGIAVAIDDDSVVIGAHQHDVDGAAYIFSRDSRSGGWSEAASLVASDGSANDRFGVSVAVDGVRAVVGAHLYEQAGLIRTDGGTAYVFSRDLNGWRESVKLAAPYGASYDEFGHSVALSGDTVLAGAPQRDPSLPATKSGMSFAMDIDGRTDAKIWTDVVATELTYDADREEYYYRALDLTNAQEYGFRARSVNDAGSGAAAEFPSVTPMRAKPGATSGLSAQRGDGRVTLRWDRSDDSTITGYQVVQHGQHKLNAGSDGQTDGQFGLSVAVDGDTAVAGAPWHDEKAGAAYVFVRDSSGWGRPVKLTPNDGAAGDQFGHSVTIDGDVIVVGALEANDGKGAAYIFVRESSVWRDPIELTASDGVEGDNFGYSVAVDGDTVVVGAYWHEFDDGGNQLWRAGAAYVFSRDAVAGTWGNDNPDMPNSNAHRTETAKLFASDRALGDYFGSSVAVHGDAIVIGARLDDVGGNGDAGSAYIFTKQPMTAWTTGTETAKVSAEDGKDNHHFGWAVAVYDGTPVIGAPNADAAYLFSFDSQDNEWKQQAKLTATEFDDVIIDDFGSSVAVHGDVVVVGAPATDLHEDASFASGAAYLFTKPSDGWADSTESATLILPAGGAAEEEDRFGNSVDVDGQHVVIGAYEADTEGDDDFGAMYASDMPAWTDIDPSSDSSAAHTVRGLSNGMEYYFQVRAFDDVGVGPPSWLAWATPVPAFDSPQGFATGLWSDGAILWLARNGAGADDAVYAYDIESRERVEDREFELDKANVAPRGVWSDGATIWVSDSGKDKLFAHDLENGERLPDSDMELARDNRDARGIWSDGVTMWVLDGRADALFAYDLETGALLGEYELDSANNDPRGLWSDSVSVWVSDHGARRLFAYRLPAPEGPAGEDAEAGDLKRVPDEEFTNVRRSSNNPRGIWSDGDVMYVADASDDKVYSYNMPDAIDARLASLTLSGVEIGKFSSNTSEYEGVLADGVTETTVAAKPQQDDATVLIEPADSAEDAAGHQAAVAGGAEVTVTVTSPDGSRTKVYRVGLAAAGPWASCLRGAVAAGFSLVVFEGGSIEDLAACAQSRHVTALYIIHDGKYLPYVLGAPDFVNRPFRDRFAAGVAALTPLIAKSDGPPSPDPTPDSSGPGGGGLTQPWLECLRGAGAAGFSLVVFEGGSIEELAACAQSRHVSALYILHDGAYLSYILGAPDFVNRPFRDRFVDGVPALTPLIAKSDGPPSPDPTPDSSGPGGGGLTQPWLECLRGAGAAGFSLVVFEGGSIEELAACAQSRHVTALYIIHDGKYLPYILGAPDFVNHPFRDRFAAGVPALTPLIAKSDGPPSPDPTPDSSGPGGGGLTQPWLECLRGAGAAGFSLVVFEGGSIEELAACAQSRHVTALYIIHDGKYLPYILGAPDFVNRPFRDRFAAGVPALTPLIAKSDGPPAADTDRGGAAHN